MPTLVYKLKFEIDKSKIKGIDKIVSKEAADSIKKTTSELGKISQSSNKASTSVSKFRKEVNEVIEKLDLLSSRTKNVNEKLAEARSKHGANSREAKKHAKELQGLSSETMSLNKNIDHQLSRYKLTTSERKKLNDEQFKASRILKKQTDSLNANQNAINLNAQKKKELAQAEREAAKALDIVNNATLKQSQELNKVVRGANKFAESQDKLNRSTKENISNLGANNKATAQSVIQSKQSIKSIDDQIRSVNQLINTGNLNESQKTKANATLTRLNSTRERAVENIRRYRQELNKTTKSSDNFTTSQKRQTTSMNRAGKSMSIGNQLAFSFGDIINDAAQFNYGFATGMRAIGNNIGFTAEMFMLLNMQAHMTGTTLGALVKSALTPLTIGLVGLNTAVTLVTVVSQKMESASKKAASGFEELLSATIALKEASGTEEFSFMNEDTLKSEIQTIKQLKPILDEISKASGRYTEQLNFELKSLVVLGRQAPEYKKQLEDLEKKYGITVEQVQSLNQKLEENQNRLDTIQANKAITSLAVLEEQITNITIAYEDLFKRTGRFDDLEGGAKAFFEMAAAAREGSQEQLKLLEAGRKLSEQLKDEKNKRDEVINSTKAAHDEVRKLNEEALQEGREEDRAKALKKEAEDFVKSYQGRYEAAQETVDRFGMHGLRHGQATFQMLREERQMMLMNNEFAKEMFAELLSEEQKFQQARQKILADDPSTPTTDDDKGLQEALAVEQLMFDTSLFGLDEHERKKLEINRKYEQMRLDFLRQGMNSAELMRAIDAAKHAELEEAKTEKEKTEQEKRREFLDTALAFTGQFVGAFGALKQQEINNELKAAKARKASATEIDKINRKKFESNKRMQLANAVINTAEAVTERLDKPLLAAAIGALGAIQIATIASTKYESASVGSVGSASGAGASGGIMSSTDTNQAPTQRISFMPTAQDSTPDQKTEINVNLDRGGLAANVRKGEREIAASQVRR